ncbi:hypothetical protein [Burkholderia ubonensis]|uniref:hypothetical protein n=1 Tax=Burkholderia ubonensis TaxID=101571 RepID=UPI0007575366|nr:hypothetical protein [Burkholderia ubonensis]KVK96222.1 hypothetical protein WJ45_20125 [Burkholderia ubonensis]KVQ44353.1 hypothetical protein WK04_15630 [Burkholderia ubonensis]
MINQLIDIKDTDTLDDLRNRLANAIGWPEPVPVGAFHRAVSDPSYAAALITSRNMTGFLEPLLHDPRNAAYDTTSKVANFTNTQLVARAAEAMVRWGKAGFSVADDETINRREAACVACPHLGEPNKTLQKLLPARPIRDETGHRTGNKVCTLCGCQVSKKVRLPTENCPGAHPTRPGLSRWLEPLPSALTGHEPRGLGAKRIKTPENSL